MKFVKNNYAAYLLACTVGCLFVLAGCSSDDDSPVVDIDDTDDTPATTVTVSGSVTNSASAPLVGANIEGVYTTPGDAGNATATTDSAGAFTLTVNTGTPFYVHGSGSGYATLNYEKVSLSTSISVGEIEVPTETEAQEVIDAAFPTTLPQLANHAWLAVDVYDEVTDAEVGGKVITSSVTPLGSAYIDCTGAPSTTGATVACASREGTMYLAYFGSTTEATVTVDGEPKLAPLNLGEITVLEYEVAAAVVGPTAFELGRDYYDSAQCGDCHAAGSYDTSGLELYDMGEALILDLNTIGGMGSVSPIDQATLDNLFAFLEDPSIAP
jgi:hypothetical protein